ncbi:MAG: DUF1667 domain-containing protein [Clostridia bacterium]|nr:DUF1667 domain-containing protein [Clostridia bacterium]
MKELVCIVCPKGCRLRVDEENGYLVSGNSCVRGAEYGKNEILNPTRVLTSTVKMEGGLYRRCPVKTNIAVPKGKLFDIMNALNAVTLTAPVQVGQVVIENVCGTGADVIATKAL